MITFKKYYKYQIQYNENKLLDKEELLNEGIFGNILGHIATIASGYLTTLGTGALFGVAPTITTGIGIGTWAIMRIFQFPEAASEIEDQFWIAMKRVLGYNNTENDKHQKDPHLKKTIETLGNKILNPNNVKNAIQLGLDFKENLKRLLNMFRARSIEEINGKNISELFNQAKLEEIITITRKICKDLELMGMFQLEETKEIETNNSSESANKIKNIINKENKENNLEFIHKYEKAKELNSIAMERLNQIREKESTAKKLAVDYQQSPDNYESRMRNLEAIVAQKRKREKEMYEFPSQYHNLQQSNTPVNYSLGTGQNNSLNPSSNLPSVQKINQRSVKDKIKNSNVTATITQLVDSNFTKDQIVDYLVRNYQYDPKTANIQVRRVMKLISNNNNYQSKSYGD